MHVFMLAYVFVHGDGSVGPDKDVGKTDAARTCRHVPSHAPSWWMWCATQLATTTAMISPGRNSMPCKQCVGPTFVTSAHLLCMHARGDSAQVRATWQAVGQWHGTVVHSPSLAIQVLSSEGE